MPVRRGVLISAWVEILSHAGGFALTLPFYVRRSSAAIAALTVGLAVVIGLLAWIAWRSALRRVIAPPPPGAVMVPEQFPLRDVAWSVGWACLLIVASRTHLFSPAFFGPGVGAGLAKLWSAHEIEEFERTEGRRVLTPMLGQIFGGEETDHHCSA